MIGIEKISILNEILNSNDKEPIQSVVKDSFNYTQAQIACSIIYQQRADHKLIFEERNKEKEIKEFAKKYGVSWKNLRANYNKLNKEDSERSKVIKDQKCMDAILKILLGNTKAIIELKKDLKKIS